MKRILFIIFSTLVLSSCGRKDKIPSEVIKPEEMKDILWDVARAKGLASVLSQDDTLNLKEARTEAYVRKALEVHQIDSTRFAKSYQWYVSHPMVMNKILDSLFAQKDRSRLLRLPPDLNEK